MKSAYRDLDEIVCAAAGPRIEGKDAVENFAAAFKTAQTQALRACQRFLLVESTSVIFCKAKKMPAFFTEAYLQCTGFCMFDGIVHDLLDHTKYVYFFFLGDLYFFY